jgi:hypothetical protein
LEKRKEEKKVGEKEGWGWEGVAAYCPSTYSTELHYVSP